MLDINEIIDLTVQLCKIPAPSNHEEARAEFCKRYFDHIGVKGAYIDEALNAVAPVDIDKFEDIAVIMAHTDTVFPDTAPFNPVIKDGYLHCPGAGDDTVHLAGMMVMLKDLIKSKRKANIGLIFVANSGEEGLGNLKGVRKIMQDYGKRVKEFITLDSHYAHMVNRAVGSHRYKIDITAQGGHSLSDFGNSNALHAASQLTCALYDIKVPAKENTRTTFNVGSISGGTSVNTIAQSATMLYEYRSDDVECLKYMQEIFEKTVETVREMRKNDGVEIKVELIGERPCAAGVDENALRAMEKRCIDAYRQVCGWTLTVDSGSTDCNIPLSMGIPCACIGVCNQQGVHTREEKIELASLEMGANAAYKVIQYYFD